MFCSAGISLAFFFDIEMGKIAGGTPALQKRASEI